MKLKSNLSIESTSFAGKISSFDNSVYGTMPFDYNMLVITVSQCIN